MVLCRPTYRKKLKNICVIIKMRICSNLNSKLGSEVALKSCQKNTLFVNEINIYIEEWINFIDKNSETPLFTK